MSATRMMHRAVRSVGALAVSSLIAGLITLSGPAGASWAAGPTRADVVHAGTGQPAAAVVSVGVTLGLTSISPSAVTPQTDLVITGSVRNSGNQALTDVQIGLRVRTPVLEDRTAIDSWLSSGAVNGETSSLPARPAPSEVRLKSLAAGASRHFTLTEPAGMLGLYAGSSFGPRAVALVATDKTGTLSQLRSTIVWTPRAQVDQTKLSILVPITETAASTQAGQPTETIAHDLAPGGRLNKLITATSDARIGWAIDPAILSSAQQLAAKGVDPQTADANTADDPTGKESTGLAGTPSAGPSATPTGAGAPISADVVRSQAQTWLDTVKSGRSGREVFGLPFADPDLASLLSTKQALSLLRHSDTLGQTAATNALGSPLDDSLAWPADGKINAAALAALGRAGRTAVVLASAGQRPSPAVDYTPSGHSVLHGGGATLTGLLYDEQLSQLVTSTGSAAQATGQTAGQSRQTLLAQLAAITLERPDDTRQVLAVVPRTWVPSRAGVQTLMTALRSAPWISLRSSSSLSRAAAPPRRSPSYRASDTASQLPPGQITSALAMSRGLDAFGPALIDPEPVVEPLREQIASLLSVSWRTNRLAMSDQRGAVASLVDHLVSGVQLQVGARWKLFTARSAPFPLYVTNSTNYPVKVVVRLNSQSAALEIRHTLTVLAPAHSQTPARIPARAIANGNVVVQGELLTTTGQILDTAPNFTVRVRPNWESRGMIGAAIVLGLLLLIGLFRSIRKRRRPRVPLESVPDVDDLATRRAAQAAQPMETTPPVETPSPGDVAAPATTSIPAAT